MPPTNYAKGPPKYEAVGLLDPWTLRWELGDKTVLRVLDRRAYLAGREALCVEVKTVSLDYPPSGPLFGDGAEDHALLVDAEVGTILRFAARLKEQEFGVAEVGEIAFDETFPEDTFRLELPGVEFTRIDG